jgi:ribosomal protein S18 acetylase RimI-like enzyme
MVIENPNLPSLIVPAAWRDFKGLRQLEKECFPIDAWPLLDLISVLSFPNIIRLKAVINDQIVGFIAGDLRPSKDMAWIATIGVLPKYQRRGIASALLRACEQQLNVRRIRLSVRVKNSPAIRLYEGFGYTQVGRWIEYYQDGSDAIVFEKTCRSTL